MRGSGRLQLGVVALVLACAALMVPALLGPVPSVAAQEVSIDEVADRLESEGFYLEDGADGTSDRFAELVSWADGRTDGPWYFVSLCCPVGDAFADELRDAVSPRGNVIVFYFEEESTGDLFEIGQFASDGSENRETAALNAALADQGWQDIDDFMRLVIEDFAGSAVASGSAAGSATTTTTSETTPTPDSGGSGAGWLWLGVPIVGGGGALWFASRRKKKKAEEQELETAQKIRAEIQTELDELANDVIVLSSPVDLSEKPEAIQHYRDATETYTEISDSLPAAGELASADLDKADLRQLSELGARISYARWQMDAAEAIIGGDEIPEKPQIEPPAPPPKPPSSEPRTPKIDPTRQPRPRVPYSRSRSRSGGGLLDILIAGAGMLGRSGGSGYRGGRSGGMFGGGSRSGGGGMFGGSSRQQPRSSRPRSSGPRSGGGVFGGGSSRGSSGRSSGRSSSRTSSRKSSRSGRSSSTARRRSTRSRSSSSRRGRRR